MEIFLKLALHLIVTLVLLQSDSEARRITHRHIPESDSSSNEYATHPRQSNILQNGRKLMNFNFGTPESSEESKETERHSSPFDSNPFFSGSPSFSSKHSEEGDNAPHHSETKTSPFANNPFFSGSSSFTSKHSDDGEKAQRQSETKTSPFANNPFFSGSSSFTSKQSEDREKTPHQSQTQASPFANNPFFSGSSSFISNSNKGEKAQYQSSINEGHSTKQPNSFNFNVDTKTANNNLSDNTRPKMDFMISRGDKQILHICMIEGIPMNCDPNGNPVSRSLLRQKRSVKILGQNRNVSE